MPPTLSTKSLAKKVTVTPLQNRPKAAIRAKSGCYTCRLRRKKCDEERVGDETGPCKTCHRLNLECLGFGAKRPEWLRDSKVVNHIRDKIKDFLASKGMIKGHAGNGSRVQVQDDFLRLSDFRDMSLSSDVKEYPSSSSSEGPGREDSVESDHFLTFQQSSLRAQYFDPEIASSRCDSPMMDSLFPYDYLAQYQPPSVMNEEFATPATSSRLSTLYHAHFTIDDPEQEYEFDAMKPSPSIIFPSNILPDYLIHDSVHHYVSNVIKIQYLLGDKVMLPEMIWEAVNRHTASKEAVTLLSQAYHSRQIDRNSFVLRDEMVQYRVSKLKEMLSAADAKFNADDAMAALHIVSLYLFEGGQGKWDEFLTFALSYTIRVLEDPRYSGSYADALDGANKKDEFVVKTTIWFDVLGSITTMKPPHLLKYIRQLFQPALSWIPRRYSMLSPMGCENIVVWALAETSSLAYWKTTSEKQGNLSIRQLVNKVQEIEPWLLPGPRPIEPRDGSDGWSRYLVSEIFRTSTRLFLKSIESGDHPHVLEIKSCVEDTLNAILSLPPPEAGMDKVTVSAVVRSTVFAFYICGSLTDSEPILLHLQSRLTQTPGGEGIGNTATISELLTQLWDQRRMQTPGQPVRWRKLLRDKRVLLV